MSSNIKVNAREEIQHRNQHPYWIWDSIQSIPKMLSACNSESVSAEIEQIVKECRSRSINKIVMLGRGSSYFVALAVKPFLEKMTNLPVSCYVTNVFDAYPYEQCDANTVAFFLSHSGKSEGDIWVIDNVKKKGVYTVGVTDIRESAFATHVDQLLLGPGGAKVEIPATRTYATAIYRMLLLGFALAKSMGITADVENYQRACEEIPGLLEAFIPRYETIAPKIVEVLKDCKNLIIVGFGPNHANAEEAAMAFVQSCDIPSAGYELENYIHGPIQALTKDAGIIAIAPSGALQDRMFNLVSAARTIGAKTVLFAPEEGQAPEVDYFVGLPAQLPDLISPVVYMVPLWQTSYHFGLLGTGANPDRLSMDKPEFQKAFSYLMKEDKWVTQK